MMASLQCWDVEEPWLDVHCELGEAPFFEEATNSIRFLDIKKRTLHSANLRDGLSSLSSVLLPTRVTVTADIEGVDSAEKILVGSKYGPAILDRRTGHIEVIEEFYQPRNERIRSNDGACGPHGEFWLGTMTDFDLGEFQPEGTFDTKIYALFGRPAYCFQAHYSASKQAARPKSFQTSRSPIR